MKASMERWYPGLRVIALVALTALPVGCSRSAPRDATQAAGTAPVAQASSAGSDPCALISQSEVSAVVGNPVDKAEHQGAGTCKWDTPNSEDVSVLLIVHAKGGTYEPYLCGELRKKGGTERLDGLDVAAWKFQSWGIFNSGDVEGCGPKGYLSLQLSGKRDEAQLKKATFAIAGEVLKRQ